jgi:hypothetical protein
MSMRNLTRAARRELSALQLEVRRLGAERDQALRMFLVSRSTTVRSGQREFWLEFVWLTEEYRYAVQRLVSYCASLDAQVRPADGRPRASDKRMTRDSERSEA